MKFTHYKVLAEPKTMEKEVNGLRRGIETITALEQLSTERRYKGELAKLLNITFAGAFYSVFGAPREAKNTKFLSNV